MVINWSLIFILPSLFMTINAVSLLDYPMEEPYGNFIFHSVLTDVSTSQQWQITESLAGIAQVHGKIQVTKADTHKFEIFYHKDRDDQRLLLNNDYCSLVSYNTNSWSTLLPGVEKSLVNMILILGPSLIYRFDTYAFKWLQEKDIGEEEEEVRGVQVISYSTYMYIGSTMKIIVYFESDLDLEEGIRNPLRIIFEDVKSGSSIKVDKIILDIYSIKSIDDKLDQYVEVTPGFGCNIYFQPNRPFPKVSGSQVHLVTSESLNKNDPFYQVDRMEIFADIEMNYLRITKGSSKEETLYDTDLGIGYTFDQTIGTCTLVPLTAKTPGIDSKGSFNLDQLFLVQGSIKYVGNIYLPNKWPFAVDYWESTVYNVQLDNDDFDKVVTTYYFATTKNKLGYIEHKEHTVPTSVIRKGTRNMDKSSYTLYQRRDIYEFQATISDDQYKGAFQINSCVNDWNQKKSLTLLIDSQDSDGLKFAEQNVHQLREFLRKLITEVINISPLRIIGLDLLFTDNRVKAVLGFIEAPRLEESFESSASFIDTSVLIDKSFPYQTDNAEECLKFLSSNTELRSVVYCGLKSLCIGVKDLSLLAQAESQSASSYVCKVFMIPFGNLNHLRKQIALEDIEQAFKSKIVDLTIELPTDDGKVKHEYKIVEIVDISTDSKSNLDRQAFTVVKEGAKLNVNQPVGLIKPVDVKSYGSCYRSCEQSDQLDCSVFSYCYNETTKSSECLVSSGLNVTGGDDHDDDKFILDSTCTVNKRNLLFDYMKIPSKVITDWSMFNTTGYPSSIEDCVVKCSQSTDCFSFQYCNSDSTCFLPVKSNQHNHQQHHQETNSSANCDFYLLKAENYFQITGTKLITDITHTVADLSLDQCAATCFNWRSSETESSECRSFNFCAKGQANLCQISGATVHDKGVQLTDSTNCINYEIISTARRNRDQLNSREKVSGLSGGSIAMIILFIAIGLAFGSGSPFAYEKIKEKYPNEGLPMQRLS